MSLTAYDLARLDGFTGTKAEWLAGPKKAAPEYLKGRDGLSAYEVALSQGFDGSEDEWLESLKGADGASAYQIAVGKGFEGSEQEWLESLVGRDGRSAYLVWRDINGGTVQEFLDSLVGPRGLPGPRGENGIGKPGTDGVDGAPGEAPEHRWVGTQLQFRQPNGEWGPLVNLQGRTGGSLAAAQLNWQKVEW